MTINAKVQSSSGVKSTVQTSSQPIVTKMVGGVPSIDNITGFNVDYDTIVEGEILVYNASSNTFTNGQVSLSVGDIDGGVHGPSSF